VKTLEESGGVPKKGENIILTRMSSAVERAAVLTGPDVEIKKSV